MGAEGIQPPPDPSPSTAHLRPGLSQPRVAKHTRTHHHFPAPAGSRRSNLGVQVTPPPPPSCSCLSPPFITLSLQTDRAAGSPATAGSSHLPETVLRGEGGCLQPTGKKQFLSPPKAGAESAARPGRAGLPGSRARDPGGGRWKSSTAFSFSMPGPVGSEPLALVYPVSKAACCDAGSPGTR